MIICCNFLSPLPSSIFCLRSFLPSSRSEVIPLTSNICSPRTIHTSYKGSVSGILPLNNSTASCTSRALPTAFPKGWFISVTSAHTCLFSNVPIFTIVRASLYASSFVRINAPLPVFTSRTIASAPLASFLDMILDAISGMERTVAVTSLKAYIFLSAGTRLPV